MKGSLSCSPSGIGQTREPLCAQHLSEPLIPLPSPNTSLLSKAPHPPLTLAPAAVLPLATYTHTLYTQLPFSLPTGLLPHSHPLPLFNPRVPHNPHPQSPSISLPTGLLSHLAHALFSNAWRAASMAASTSSGLPAGMCLQAKHTPNTALQNC